LVIQSCPNGYSGTNCNYPICYAVLSTDITVCSGNGNCTSPNVCQCNSSYGSNNCQSPLCFGNLTCTSITRGTCTSPNVCQCNLPYTGVTCQLLECAGLNTTSDSCPSPPPNNNLYYLFFLAIIPIVLITFLGGFGMGLVFYLLQKKGVTIEAKDFMLKNEDGQ